MKHLKRFNEEFGRDEVVFTSQRNSRLVNTVSISPDRRISNIDNKTGIRFPFSVGIGGGDQQVVLKLVKR